MMDTSSIPADAVNANAVPRPKPFKEYFFVEKNLPDIEEDHFLVRRHLLRQSRQKDRMSASQLSTAAFDCATPPSARLSREVLEPFTIVTGHSPVVVAGENIPDVGRDINASQTEDSLRPDDDANKNIDDSDYAVRKDSYPSNASRSGDAGSAVASGSILSPNQIPRNESTDGCRRDRDVELLSLNTTPSRLDPPNAPADPKECGEKKEEEEEVNSDSIPVTELARLTLKDDKSSSSSPICVTSTKVMTSSVMMTSSEKPNDESYSYDERAACPSRAEEPVQRPAPIIFSDLSQNSAGRDPTKQKNLGVVRPTTKIVEPVEENSAVSSNNDVARPTSDDSPKKPPRKNRATNAMVESKTIREDGDATKPVKNVRHSVNFDDVVSVYEGGPIENARRGSAVEGEDEEREGCLPFARSQSMRTPQHMDRWNNRRSSATKQLDISSVLLSDKDKKMLHLFIVKREKEREEERLRLQSHKKWEEEKCSNKNKRKSSLFEAPLSSSKERDLSSCSHSTSTDCISSNCSKYYASLDTVQISKKNEIAKTKMNQAIEKKRAVEKRLQEQKEMTSRYLKELKEKHEMELERAAQTKKTQHEKLKQKVMQMNKQAQMKQQQLKENRAAKINDIPSQHDCIDAMLSAAEEKAKRRREEDIAKIKSNLQVKIEKSQEKQRMVEEELKNWQEQIAEYRQQQDRHAEELKMAQIAKKKEMTAKSREIKEKHQKENMQRMLEMEQDWKDSLKAQINQKEERSRFIQKEKYDYIQKSRAQAHVSRLLRDEVRMNQSMTDLDQLAKHVLYSGTKNPR